MSIISYSFANHLPVSWEQKAPHVFMQKENLALLEQVNFCSQKYYQIENEMGTSLFMTYRLPLNILTYSRMRLKFMVTMVGLPLSVSQCGYHILAEHHAEFFAYLASQPGWKLILNAPDYWEIPGWSRGETLSSCELTNRWMTFEDYLQSMRSPYRYRIQKAQKKWAPIREVELAPEQFDEKLYGLYENVYEHSEAKLEKQPMDFFRNFPATILAFYRKDQPLGFVQLVEQETELIFLLGGFDYELNLQYDIYWNMLLAIVKRGIDRGFRTIELGQTAEETKLKLGCSFQTKYMYVHHSNGLLNKSLRWLIPYLSYRKPKFAFNVFKEARS